MLKQLLPVLSLALAASVVHAQHSKEGAPASPRVAVTQQIGPIEAMVDYSRPSVKGRKIFGELVPFGSVWRTGANASTKLNFSGDVKFGDKDVPAGKYALYAIPDKKNWTLIVHKTTDMWGANGYDEANDLVRVEVPVQKLKDLQESMVIEFDTFTANGAHLVIAWAHSMVRVPVAWEADPEARPVASPHTVVEQQVGTIEAKVDYSRPSMRKRDVFGKLVGYDKVWRTGANASTKVSFTGDVKFGDQEVPAGDYALYTIPNKSDWTVILHKKTDMWGANGYDATNDLIRVEAPVVKMADTQESFRIDFNGFHEGGADLAMSWGNTMVKVPVTASAKMMKKDGMKKDEMKKDEMDKEKMDK